MYGKKLVSFKYECGGTKLVNARFFARNLWNEQQV